MYCNNCGKNNPKNSKFCQRCGIKLGRKIKDESLKTKIYPEEVHISSGEPSQYSIRKFTILLIFTYGSYYLYWFWRNWKLIKKARKSDISPGWRTAGLFVPILNLFLLYKQFNEIKRLADEKGIKANYSPGWRLVFFLLFQTFYLGFLSPLVLNKIQKTFNDYWKIKEPQNEPDNTFSIKEIIFLILFGAFYLLILVGLLSPGESSSYKTTYKSNFVQSCEETSGSGKEQYCNCVADYMVNNFSETQLTSFDQEYNQTNQLPQEIQTAANSCASDYSQTIQ